MKNIIVIASVVVLAAGAFFIFKSQKPTREKTGGPSTFQSGAFTFRLSPLEKLGVAAHFLSSEVTHEDLLQRSPVLQDLTLKKYTTLMEAANSALASDLKKADKKVTMTLYMDKLPNKPKHHENINLVFSDERPDNAVLKINDKTYDRTNLPLNQVYYSQIENKIFEEKLRVVADLYLKQLLLKISKENKTTIQGFINKTILKSNFNPITDAEVAEFAKAKGISLGNANAALKESFRNIIREQKTQKSVDEYIIANYPNEIGKIFFSPPRMEIPLEESESSMAANDADKNAPRLMVFSKMKCGSCGTLAQNLNAVRDQYKRKIRIGFVHYLNDNDWRDALAAQAAMCLNNQSHDAFWEFFSQFSSSNEETTESLIMEMAKKTDSDFEKFKKCFVGQTYKDELERQIRYAKDLGITVTPTIIIKSNVLSGDIVKNQIFNSLNASL